MKDFQFIFLRLSVYLVAGIISAFYISAEKDFVLLFFGSSLLLFLFSYFRARRQIFTDLLTGIAAFLLIFSFGYLIGFHSIPENQSDHYLHQKENSHAILEARISEELKPNSFNHRFIVEAENIISNEQIKYVHGKLLLNIQTDSLQKNGLKPGDIILLPWKPEAVRAPLNPFQFNYKKYLQRLKIERQISLKNDKVKLVGHKTSVSSWAWKLRENLISDLKHYSFRNDEVAVLQALILGERRDISDRLYKTYAAAGAIHILAISGLHIGILLLLLNHLLKPLESIQNGKIIKPILLIILLWCFAVLTGLSPSVVRAVCMFSFLAVGMQLKRKTSTLNSLFLSFFMLLIINPYYIFQAGFQMSFLAVFSIIVLQPKIYNFFEIKNKYLNYFWKLIAVSIAAQIGVLPLSLFYFHQFPGLFLLTNIIIIPFLGLILSLGILVIILASAKILPVLLVDFFGRILSLMNKLIENIADIESLVFSGIRLSFSEMISLYLILLASILLIQKINFHRISFFLLGILSFQIFSFYSRIQIPERETVIFHRSKESIIAEKELKNLSVYSKNMRTEEFLKDYIRERKIHTTKLEPVPNIVALSGNLSMIIDTTGVYTIPDFKPEILILAHSPKINLERILLALNPEVIVADGSNYRNYIERWKLTAKNKKIPFHYTGEKGAYIITKKD